MSRTLPRSLSLSAIAALTMLAAAPSWSQATPAQPADPAQPTYPGSERTDPPTQPASPAQPAVPPGTTPAEEMDCKHLDKNDTSNVSAEQHRRLVENCAKADRDAPRKAPQK